MRTAVIAPGAQAALPAVERGATGGPHREIVTLPLPDPMTMPTRRTRPLDPPEEYARLRADRPFSRLRLPGGRIGWLVTRYEHARALLEDPRLTPPLVQVTPATEPPVPGEHLEVPPGTFSALDPPESTRYRRLISRHFTRKHMRELAPLMERIVDDHVRAMTASGCPADLIAQFADPVPAIVITDMLGIPAADGEGYQRWVSTILSLGAAPDEIVTARTGIYGGLGELIRATRKRPGKGIVSDLLQASPLSDEEVVKPLSDEEVVNMTALLLITGMAGAHMLGLGAFALLQHPDQIAAIQADESLLEPMVEELLRYLTPVQYGATRTAREDLEIDGQPIRAGETIVVSMAAANRDPGIFPEPDRLDVGRTEQPHLAFGAGAHHCLGAQLARAEMTIGFRALFRQLPTLRLAVPPEEVPMRDAVLYGVRALPVAWDR